MPIKREHAAICIRVPIEMKRWLEQRAERSFASQNAEIVRSIRERMDREKAEARSQRMTERA
jgi:predicted transcriptional regulator